MTSINEGTNGNGTDVAAVLRISDADRNGTLRRLHNAVALGLIDIDEFEERFEAGVDGEAALRPRHARR